MQPYGVLRFQFQTGAIKSESADAGQGDANLFQFQTGAIKSSLYPCALPAPEPCFNSKLVRLKVYDTDAQRITDAFQFQTGAIKSKPTDRGLMTSLTLFQFQTGAIKRDIAHRVAQRSDRVSIPNWCD